ncbi:hypothetical protein [Micropruina sonneratiae]|uniref:hypothetical protein n=1 Tax=Micropruina sonneratiae TaxID=2986940 RepID=UPI002225D1CB|nr:hypothetical protein [Micropruina sp. KQZ13P-5]MCW3158600.1 hypothetical protein [Micropruina sp. KQZ13P-5]
MLLDRIEQRSRQLEKILKGFDAFDTLAFLRFASELNNQFGIADTGAPPESDVVAQEVVAYVLLGMGLPRRPLTGEPFAQPDVGALLRLGGQIAEDASNLAAFERALSARALDRLAGKLAGYEARVRGRQYESIAADMNDGLLLRGATAAILREVLGFTLGEIRSIRTAAVDLLNTRLFGTRDRVGDLAQRYAQGAPLTPSENDEFRQGIVTMLSECRRFGCVTVNDLATNAGLPVDTTRNVLDYFATTRPESNVKEMIDRYLRGDRIRPWGCISDDDEYLLLQGFLDEPELRRDLERSLTGSPKWTTYDRQRATFAETRTIRAITKLLHGEKPRWEQQKYWAPIDPKDIDSLAGSFDPAGAVGKIVESDALFVVDGAAFCIEVKAGSITDRARAGSMQRLDRDLAKTLQEANEQADRLAALIRSNHGVWGGDGRWIDLSEVREVHSIVVTLDDLGLLSLSLDELVVHGVINSEAVPWVVSLHDLIVASQVFDHAAQFLTFVRRRCGRKLATMVTGVDELDMIMWFLDGGMYFEPDPDDVAEQQPVAKSATRASRQRYNEQPRVILGTMTDPLDAWFDWNEGRSDTVAPKPSREEAPWINQYLAASESRKAPGWLRFGADLVTLSEEAQLRMGASLLDRCREAGRSKSEHSMFVHGVSEAGSWALVAWAECANAEHAAAYTDLKKYQTKASRSMLLLYDKAANLQGMRYDDRLWEQSDAMDAAVAAAPLMSLEDMVRPVPPSARRGTKRLRGRHGGRR